MRGRTHFHAGNDLSGTTLVRFREKGLRRTFRRAYGKGALRALPWPLEGDARGARRYAADSVREQRAVVTLGGPKREPADDNRTITAPAAIHDRPTLRRRRSRHLPGPRLSTGRQDEA